MTLNKLPDHLKLTVQQDFLDKFDINVTKSNISVCLPRLQPGFCS